MLFFKFIFLMALFIWTVSIPIESVAAPSLSQLIELATANNPDLSASKKMAEAEDSLVASKATLEDPMVGLSSLDRGMKTQYGTITQKVRFPVKYYHQSKIQRSRADIFLSTLEAKRLELRQEVISQYFSIYTAQKIIQLTQANSQAVKEFARVAEKKYAAGKSPQGDSMKAHFELTQLELELLRLRQEEAVMQDKIRVLVNDQSLERIELGHRDLASPAFYPDRLAGSLAELTSTLQAHSPLLKSESQLLKQAEHQSSLSNWEYAPDFQVQYQQRIAGDPEDSQILSLGVTIPLWFWKQKSQASSASAMQIAQSFKLTDATQKLIAKIKDFKGRVTTEAQSLKIYQTSLIPQAQSSYVSARSAYQASKTSFLDLLDSERSLYRVRAGYYKTLSQYVRDLTGLEAQLGFAVSNLDNQSGDLK